MDILFFAVVAAFVIYRMFNVMGTPDDEMSRRAKELRRQAMDQAYPVPGQSAAPKEVGEESQVKTAPLYSKDADPSVVAVVDLVHQRQADFNESFFLEGAAAAFEIILKAFNEGDKKTLQDLLTEEVFAEFSAAIDARETSHEYPDTTLIGMKSTHLKEGKIYKGGVSLSVRFLSEQITLMRDKDRTIIAGDASYIQQVEDIWTFYHKTTASDVDWKLSATTRVQ
jgi:predicted lipid-binding transport protein (Tim44 family)